MEDDDQRAPLLGAGAGGRSPSLRRRDSARSLRSTFLSQLPDKVRAGLDPERPTDDVDLARAKCLSPGKRLTSSAAAPVAYNCLHGVGLRSFFPCWLRVGEREYYEKQLATLRTFEEVEKVCMPDEFDSDLEAFEDKELKQSESAMKISNYANIVLLIFKVNSCFLRIVEWNLATPPVGPFGLQKMAGLCYNQDRLHGDCSIHA
jgi:hypothetical protein